MFTSTSMMWRIDERGDRKLRDVPWQALQPRPDGPAATISMSQYHAPPQVSTSLHCPWSPADIVTIIATLRWASCGPAGGPQDPQGCNYCNYCRYSFILTSDHFWHCIHMHLFALKMHKKSTYTRSLSSKVVRKYSSKLIAIFAICVNVEKLCIRKIFVKVIKTWVVWGFLEASSNMAPLLRNARGFRNSNLI